LVIGAEVWGMEVWGMEVRGMEVWGMEVRGMEVWVMEGTFTNIFIILLQCVICANIFILVIYT